jgi:Protein of unknown function (DUF1579)
MSDRSYQSEFDAPPPDPELQRLEPLLGTWTTEGHTQHSVFGPGVPVTSTETFRWLDGGYFLVQEYETNSAMNRLNEAWSIGATTPRSGGS